MTGESAGEETEQQQGREDPRHVGEAPGVA
jgi:hypothetical protein